jgi:hypothetical protein
VSFKIIKIPELPLADGIDGSSLFAVYHNGVTVRVPEAMLLDLIEATINLADVPFNPAGNTKLTATNILGVLTQIEQELQGSGINPFDQNLNTTNDVEFVDINFTGNLYQDGVLFEGGGGDSFDQDLNTTNNVEFVDLNFTGDLYKDGVLWNPASNYYEKTFVAGEYLLRGDICFLASDGKMYKTNATVEATSSGLLGMARDEDIAVDASGPFIMWGEVDGFTDLTPGSIFYLDTLDGERTTAQPANSTEIVRVVGYALSDTVLIFDPSKTWIERV